MVREQLVEAALDLEDFLRVDGDVRGLALEAAQRLVDHHAGIRQAEALALFTGGQQEGAHGGGLADAGGGDAGLHELHGVVDGHAGGNRAPRRIDVDVDVLVRVFRLQEEELGDHEVGHLVFDGADDEDQALFEQARVDVEGTFATGGLLDNHGHEAEILGRQQAGIGIQKLSHDGSLNGRSDGPGVTGKRATRGEKHIWSVGD